LATLAGIGAAVRISARFLTFCMAADIDAQAATDRRTRLWIAPLLAGCCFSLSYGITHRLMAIQTSVREIKPEAFPAMRFPGTSLDQLRSRSGDRRPLQVDLAAIDAREAAEKARKSSAKPLAQGSGGPTLALQTPPAAAWTVAPEPFRPAPVDPAPAMEQAPPAPVPAAAVELKPAVEPIPAVEPVAIEPPSPDPAADPLLNPAEPFEPELTNDFLLPIVPQEPLPPTP